MTYECIKNLEVDGRFKVGDILVGTTHMYRTATYWYKVIKVTKKQLTLKELQVSYPTKYMSNTPGDSCMPVLEYNGYHFVSTCCPYWLGPRDTETVVAAIEKYRFRKEDEWTDAWCRDGLLGPLQQK